MEDFEIGHVEKLELAEESPDDKDMTCGSRNHAIWRRQTAHSYNPYPLVTL